MQADRAVLKFCLGAEMEREGISRKGCEPGTCEVEMLPAMSAG